jgi:hypothetical protein
VWSWDLHQDGGGATCGSAPTGGSATLAPGNTGPVASCKGHEPCNIALYCDVSKSGDDLQVASRYTHTGPGCGGYHWTGRTVTSGCSAYYEHGQPNPAHFQCCFDDK